MIFIHYISYLRSQAAFNCFYCIVIFIELFLIIIYSHDLASRGYKIHTADFHFWKDGGGMIFPIPPTTYN